MKRLGFSMLELVVVMLIMGTLRSIAISKMGGSDTGAIKASMKSDMRNTIAGMNSCYMDTLDFHQCLPSTNPVIYSTPNRGRQLGGSIYVGLTTDGNSMNINTSDTNPKFFAISCLNSNLNLYSTYNNHTNSSITDFLTGNTHPNLVP